jgi:UDP-N-acetylglucosamine 2-epimerase (non-hydrolysing)
MLDQVLEFFEIYPDYDLNLMRPKQNLFQLTADVIIKLKTVLEDFKPDIVLVHGDTTTSTTAAIAAFYAGIKVGHVEAGLRTYNKNAPFPEEINRQITSRIADYNFAPTIRSKQNLIDEKIIENSITVTGNTVIDALLWAQEKLKIYEDNEIRFLKKIIDNNKKLILVTGHRRENFGDGFYNICKAIKQVAEENKDTQFIYPVHLNPNVQKPVYELLDNIPNINLIAPLAYPAFVWVMMKSYLILTDSGGVQEEAPSIGKPVLVMRDVTERPEAVEAGTVILVGTNTKKIVSEITNLLKNEIHYNEMSLRHNPYGDGMACYKIVKYFTSIK